MFVPLGSAPFVVALPRDADAADKRLALKDSSKPKKAKTSQDQWNAMCVHIAMDGEADALCSPQACRYAHTTFTQAMNWTAASVRSFAEPWRKKIDVRATDAENQRAVDGE